MELYRCNHVKAIVVVFTTAIVVHVDVFPRTSCKWKRELGGNASIQVKIVVL